MLSLAFVVVVSACAPAVPPLQETETLETEVVQPTAQLQEEPFQEGEVRLNRRVEDPTTYRFPQLIPPDGIRPVYNPEFELGQQVELEENELILGVAIDGQAKAYPITVLRSREMVNDELAGIPLLVTW